MEVLNHNHIKCFTCASCIQFCTVWMKSRSMQFPQLLCKWGPSFHSKIILSRSTFSGYRGQPTGRRPLCSQTHQPAVLTGRHRSVHFVFLPSDSGAINGHNALFALRLRTGPWLAREGTIKHTRLFIIIWPNCPPSIERRRINHVKHYSPLIFPFCVQQQYERLFH